MSASREPVSPETIQRAIRARLAVTFGAHSPYVVLPLTIHEIPAGDDGLNWELMIPFTESASEDGIHAALDAASDVAGSFNLGNGLH
jgi:hypothetical protein